VYHREGGDETILHRELSLLVHIMHGHMVSKFFLDHKIAPVSLYLESFLHRRNLVTSAFMRQVLMFSVMGRRARIIQGRHNGTELVVHYSKLYDFTREKDAPLDYFAQWWSCKPTGNTMPVEGIRPE